MFRSIVSLATLIALVVVQFPAGGQTRRPPARPAQPPVNAQSAALKSVKNEKLAAAFHTGQLPEPSRKPQGKPDEVAAALAKTIAVGDDQSMPALLTAILTAGFGIRDSDGGVTQTVQPGQGLIFDAWEIAAMAKMFGERRTVELSYLCDAFRAIPELKQAPLEKIIINGIRKQSSSEQPELRFWARFIVELGKRSAEPYDLLKAADDKRVRIDAIQNALILRRLMGDLHAVGQRAKQALKRSDQPGRETKVAYAHAPQQQPCRQSDIESIVNDLEATLSTWGFGELMGWIHEKIGGTAGELFEKYGKFINVANIILAYAKFIATYAALETEITIENPPLVRIKTRGSGYPRNLTAKVTMNIGKWQQVNCFRWLLNYGTGMDFSLMNDGPIEGAVVNWHITEGGFADYYHSGDRSAQLVQFKGTGPRIQDAGTSAGIGSTAVSNLTSTKTDAQGKASIILEGAYRPKDIPPPHNEVMKKAVVMTTVKIKGGDIKGDAVDILGHLLGGALTIPAELLYRTDWASTATLDVPVKDWESCDSNGWEGTITYTKKFDNTMVSDGEKGRSETVQKENYTATITFGGERLNSSSGIVNVLNANVVTKGSYYEQYTSTGKRACNRPNERTIDLSGDTQSSHTVSVMLEPDGRYRVNYQVPTVSVEGQFVTSWRLEGDCRNPYMAKSGGNKGLMSRTIDIHPVEIEGVIDPMNPHVLKGSKTETVERNGGTMTLTVEWDISHCDTP